jgi:hypothetical protein
MKYRGYCIAGLFLLACSPPSPGNAGRPDSVPAANQEPMTDSTASPTVRVQGTVRSVNVEGGCWRFDAADGKRYELNKSSAPAALFQDGRQATLTLRLRPDLMSTCQVGPIVEVVQVE